MIEVIDGIICVNGMLVMSVDFMVFNGIVYGIEDVLMFFVQMVILLVMLLVNIIVDIVFLSSNLSILVQVIQIVGLVDVFLSDGVFIVFVFINEVFVVLFIGVFNELLV